MITRSFTRKRVVQVGSFVVFVFLLTSGTVCAFDMHPDPHLFDKRHTAEPLIRNGEQRHQLDKAGKKLHVPSPVQPPSPESPGSPRYQITPLPAQPFYSPVPPSSPNYQLNPGESAWRFKVPSQDDQNKTAPSPPCPGCKGGMGQVSGLGEISQGKSGGILPSRPGIEPRGGVAAEIRISPQDFKSK